MDAGCRCLMEDVLVASIAESQLHFVIPTHCELLQKYVLASDYLSEYLVCQISCRGQWIRSLTVSHALAVFMMTL